MNESQPAHSEISETAPDDFEPAAWKDTVLALVLALVIPGAGHAYLRRIGRGLVFCLLILTAVALGLLLEGKLYRPLPGQPLTWLGTVGSMGLGLSYFVLRLGVGWEGTVEAPGFEYGTAFLLTAGLMNLMLLLDVWDLARNGKE